MVSTVKGSPKPSTERQSARELGQHGRDQLRQDEAPSGIARASLEGGTPDGLDRDKSGRASFQEFSGVTAAQRLGAGRNPTTPSNLAAELDLAMPAGATESPHLRQRLLERATRFAHDAHEMSRSQSEPRSPLGRLRSTLGGSFSEDASIALHGVASHFGPEALQARVKDRSGGEHTFVRNGLGDWVERPDLQALHANGRIPSTDPGMTRGVNPSATLGIAEVQSDGKVDIRLAADAAHMSHQPRARPFDVGETVQVIEWAGQTRVKRKGQPFVPDYVIQFGRITATDGRGNWSVQLTNGDGSPRLAKDGSPEMRTLTDVELRLANNPTVLRNGSALYGVSYDRRDPAQRRMISDFHASPAGQELELARPGPTAPAPERAAWERRAIDAADRFLDDNMRYPPKETDLASLRASLDHCEQELKTIDAKLAAARTEGAPSEKLELQRGELEAELDSLKPEVLAVERYLELEKRGANIGAYYDNKLGQCRHQAIAMQTLMQELGIDARMTRGAGNTASGDYQEEHMWVEATLADGSQLLVDPTWTSAVGERPSELEPIYRTNRRRLEDPDGTLEDFIDHVSAVPKRDAVHVDIDEKRGVSTVA